MYYSCVLFALERNYYESFHKRQQQQQRSIIKSYVRLWPNSFCLSTFSFFEGHFYSLMYTLTLCRPRLENILENSSLYIYRRIQIMNEKTNFHIAFENRVHLSLQCTVGMLFDGCNINLLTILLSYFQYFW